MRAARFHVIKTPFFEPKAEKIFRDGFHMEKPWSNDCITFAYTVDQCMIIQ